MPDIYSIGDRSISVALIGRGARSRLGIDGHEISVASEDAAASGPVRILVDDHEYTGWRYRCGADCYIRLNGRTLHFRQQGLAGETEDAASAKDSVSSSMPGVVVSLACAEGDVVKKGDVLLVIESMKMQTSVASPRDGVIERLHVADRAVFDKGALLVSLRPEED